MQILFFCTYCSKNINIFIFKFIFNHFKLIEINLYLRKLLNKNNNCKKKIL
jgi:hypothetical protein